MNDWSDSIIVSLLKGKGDALDQNNYRGLKLTDHVLKVIERVVENMIRETVNIDQMLFSFSPVEAQQMQFLFSNSF